MEQRVNKNGQKLCKRCHLNADAGIGYCKQCIKEVLKQRAELTKPK